MKMLHISIAIVLLSATGILLANAASSGDGCVDPATKITYQPGDGPCANGVLLKVCGLLGVWMEVPAGTRCPH